MMRLVAVLALLLLPAVAYAQPKQVVATCGAGVTLGVGDGSPGTINTAGQECVAATGGGGGAVIVTNPGIVGFGKLSLTNASTLLSTATVGPGSAVWPTIPAIIDVTNDPASADTIYACPTGSTPTCTTATGVPIYVGQTFRFTKPSTTMTLIATSTATVEVQF